MPGLSEGINNELAGCRIPGASEEDFVGHAQGLAQAFGHLLADGPNAALHLRDVRLVRAHGLGLGGLGHARQTARPAQGIAWAEVGEDVANDQLK